MPTPAKHHLVRVFLPNTFPWLEGKQTTTSKKGDLVKGTRTYRNLGLIPVIAGDVVIQYTWTIDYCSFLLMKMLIQSALSEHPLPTQPQPSNLHTRAEQCRGNWQTCHKPDVSQPCQNVRQLSTGDTK